MSALHLVASHPQTEHLDAEEYESFHQALRDAALVADDLRNQLAGQLFVPAHEIDFLVRRMQSLVAMCQDVLEVDQ